MGGSLHHSLNRCVLVVCKEFSLSLYPTHIQICKIKRRRKNVGTGSLLQHPRLSHFQRATNNSEAVQKNYLSADPEDIISPSGDQEHLIKFYKNKKKVFTEDAYIYIRCSHVHFCILHFYFSQSITYLVSIQLKLK